MRNSSVGRSALDDETYFFVSRTSLSLSVTIAVFVQNICGDVLGISLTHNTDEDVPILPNRGASGPGLIHGR